MSMTVHTVPAILVHGWKSRPRYGNNLHRSSRKTISTGFSIIRHLMKLLQMEGSRNLLRILSQQKEKRTILLGSVDIVCHSIGSCIARYLLEVNDGRALHERVRQPIAIGPPNNGSSLAELSAIRSSAPLFTGRLCETFVARNFQSCGRPCHRPSLSSREYIYGYPS